MLGTVGTDEQLDKQRNSNLQYFHTEYTLMHKTSFLKSDVNFSVYVW